MPHVVDTVLIVSAIWLAWMLRLSPSDAPWIAAKIGGLFVYIALGMVALRFGRTKGIRATAWVAGDADVRLHRVGGGHEGPARNPRLGRMM